MWVCLCNQFNETVVKEGIRALAKDLPEKPDSDALQQFYHDVYEWCGQNAGLEGVAPKCFSCFDEFISLTLQEVAPSLSPPQNNARLPKSFPLSVIVK